MIQSQLMKIKGLLERSPQKIHFITFFVLLAVIIGFFSLSTSPLGSDDGNVYFEVQYLDVAGFERIIETLGTIPPVALYSAMEAFDLHLLLLPYISTLLLIISLVLLTRELFKDILPIYLVFLFPILFERAWHLSPYSLFLFLFTFSLLLFIKGMRTQNSKYLILSPFFSALAIYTFTLSFILSIIPFLYLIAIERDIREKIRTFLVFYFFELLFLAPWIFWHFSIAGPKHFYYSPFNWYILTALPIVNQNFWNYGKLPIPDLIQLYFSEIISHVILVPILILLLIGFSSYSKNRQIIKFCCLWIIIYPLPFLWGGVSAFSRYFFPLIVPIFLISAVGLEQVIKMSRKGAYILLVIIVILGLVSVNITYFSDFSRENPFNPSSSYLDFHTFNEFIDDDKNVFCRHHAYQYMFSNNYFITQSDMEEKDAIVFLTWSSDQDVATVLSKYDIGWVILYNEKEKWEKDYYCWIPALYGANPSHHIYIRNSDKFALVKKGEIYSLYQYSQ